MGYVLWHYGLIWFKSRYLWHVNRFWSDWIVIFWTLYQFDVLPSWNLWQHTWFGFNVSTIGQILNCLTWMILSSRAKTLINKVAAWLDKSPKHDSLCTQIIQVFHKNSTVFHNIVNNQLTTPPDDQMTKWPDDQMTSRPDDPLHSKASPLHPKLARHLPYQIQWWYMMIRP